MQRTLTIRWQPVSGAERYVIEAGSSSGGSDIATFTTTGPASVTWENVPPRRAIYVRIRAENSAGISAPSFEVRTEMPDMRDVIEALFFSSGPYAIPQNAPRNPARIMTGYAAGSPVTVRVPHDVAGEQLAAVEQAVTELNAAMGGGFAIERATVMRDEWNRQRPDGVTILVNQGNCLQSDGASAACNTNNEPIPVYQRGVVLMPNLAERPETWAHELGHAAGLAHLWIEITSPTPRNVSNVFSRYKALMGGIQVPLDDGITTELPARLPGVMFTELELEAIRRVYSSGLRPGSSLADFVARDLITP